MMVVSVIVSCTKEQYEAEPATDDSGRYIIELRGSVQVPHTRISESADEINGLRTSWDPGEKIKVMYYKGEDASLAELVSASGDGLFTGSVETGEDALAFATSELHCFSTSGKIGTELQGRKAICTVDLSGQDGSLDNVAQYELMYVKGHASGTLYFEHLTSVLRLTFDGLQGSEVTSVSLSFTPSASGGGSALFATSAIYRIGPDGIEEQSEDAVFYDLKDIHVPIENGTAVIYLVIPARGKLYGELSACLSSDSAIYRCYIKLGGKSFKANNVVARTEAVSDGDRVPAIGDYVYSDGTWGPLVYYEDKWPQAVIFSNYTSAEDREAGFTHGYAMALKDAAWPTTWAPENEVETHPDYPEAPNLFESVSASAPLQMMENLSGLSTCRVLNDSYLSNYCLGNYYGLSGFERTGAEAAIPCAMRYGCEDWVYAFTDTPNITEFDPPEGSSGWFLPSAGQWFLCLSNLAGIVPDDLKMITSGGKVVELSWQFPSSIARQEYLDRFTRYFSSESYQNPILAQYYSSGRMLATSFYLPDPGFMDWYLWTCDEATSNGTAVVVYLNSTDIVFKYVVKQTGESAENGYAARSILAF